MVLWIPLFGVVKMKGYFLQRPTIRILNLLLNCFDIENIENIRIIQKNKIDEEELCKRFTSLLPDLANYLQPRILNLYFYTSKITFHNCVSILKNVAYHSKHLLMKYEMIEKARKIIQYKVITQVEYEKMNTRIFHIDRTTKRLCVFD
jgi:hypothetical protein